jgi:hypothetical protein
MTGDDFGGVDVGSNPWGYGNPWSSSDWTTQYSGADVDMGYVSTYEMK